MLKAIIVDDERSGREVLKSLLEKHFSDRIEVTALCKDVDEGITALQSNSPDLVFLDIEMPGESGFELIEKINPLNASIVFVTAYNEHAIKAFQVGAVDYLVKPMQVVDLERAITRIEKIRVTGRILTQQELLQKLQQEIFQKLASPFPDAHSKIAVSSFDGLTLLEINDITRCEASNNYTLVFTSEKKHIISRGFKDVEVSLCSYNFLRVHKSHLVNLRKVIKYRKEGFLMMEDCTKIPVGRFFKDELEKRLLVL